MDDDEQVIGPAVSSSKDGSNTSDQQAGSSDALNSKEIQTGGVASSGKPKTKDKTIKKRKKKEDDELDDNIVFIDPEERCVRHSFCVVESLKEKGVRPYKPKGLPWSSGKLLYLPGQRPPHFTKSKQELEEIIKKKKKKLKRKQNEKKRMVKKLREGDHTKLCNVINTSQELMILMRIISMVMEKRKEDQKRRLIEVQTEFDTIPEEGEEDGDDEKEDDNEEEETEVEGDEGINVEDDVPGLPETFHED